MFQLLATRKEDLDYSSDKEKVPELPRKDVEMGMNRQHSTFSNKSWCEDDCPDSSSNSWDMQ